MIEWVELDERGNRPAEPPAVRFRYYNPVLDKRAQEKMTPAMLEAVREDRYRNGGPLLEPDDDHPANLVSSLCEDGYHRPALDIDIPCEYVPSSTEGHGHLYFPTAKLTWAQYVALLEALADAGILEHRYVEHSKHRRQTLLRPPGVTK